MGTVVLPHQTASRDTRPQVTKSETGSRVSAAERDAEIWEMYRPSALRWGNIDWWAAGWIGSMHVGALAAPFFFSWSGLAIAVFMWWLTGSIGICLGYHRYLSHRSFKLTRVGQFFVYLCGCLSVEGSPLTWAANHRIHHAKSDREGDPHSPRHGAVWAHFWWLFMLRNKDQEQIIRERYLPDLMKDRMLMFFERTFIYWSIALGAVLYAAGGLSWLLWGLCFRMVFLYHSTWFVNSATHLWGYRTYETSDDSRNLWWVAVLSHGEGWHNNHHAFPSLARSGHRWWEVDITFWAIRVMQGLGMAYDIKDSIPAHSRFHHEAVEDGAAHSEHAAAVDVEHMTPSRVAV